MATMLEQSIQQLLRGAAAVLGSNAAVFIAFDEEHDTVTVWVGVHRKHSEQLEEAEALLDVDTTGLSVPISMIPDSYIVRAWREARIFETQGLAKLVAGFWDPESVAAVDRLIGDHCFACVPALGGRRLEGVVIFEKPGERGFAPVQRKLLLQYAERVAQLVEGERLGRQAFDLLELGEARSAEPSTGFLLLDAELAVRQQGGSDALPPATIGAPLAAWLEGLGPDGATAGETLAADLAGWWAAGAPESWAGRLSVPHHPGGEGRPVSVQASALDRTAGTILVQWIDLASSADLQRRLAALHERLPLILFDGASAVICLSSDLKILSHNELAARLFRCGTEDLVGHTLSDLLSEPVDLELVSRLRLIAFGYLDQALALKRRDGTTFPAQLTGLLLADEAGEPAGALISVRELGETPPWEEDRRRLEHAVERSEGLATMGEMAAQLAHELRNPLVALGASIQGLIEDPPDRKELGEELGVLAGEVLRLDSLLRDYLALAGRLHYQPARVDLAEVARSALTLVEPTATSRQCRLQDTLPEHLWAQADFDALRQVLVNLLLNAIHVSPAGATVRLGAGSERGACWLRVRDHGPGIPEADRERVFEPFYSTRRGGTGLGLTVSRRIVEDLGGTLSFEEAADTAGCAARVTLRALSEVRP